MPPAGVLLHLVGMVEEVAGVGQARVAHRRIRPPDLGPNAIARQIRRKAPGTTSGENHIAGTCSADRITIG